MAINLKYILSVTKNSKKGKLCCRRLLIETLPNRKLIWTEKNLAQT